MTVSTEGIPPSWVLYGGLILFVLGIISGANDRILGLFGKWGQAAQEKLERQRTAAKTVDDADIAQFKRAIENLEKMLESEREAYRESLKEAKLNEYQNQQLIKDLYRYILAAQHNRENLNKPVPNPMDYVVTTTHGPGEQAE